MTRNQLTDNYGACCWQAAFQHSSTVVTQCHGIVMLLCIVGELFCLCHSTRVYCLMQPQCLSTAHCIREWRERIKNWYQHIFLKPPCHGLGWRELWVLQTSLLPKSLPDNEIAWCEKCASLVWGRVFGAWPLRSMTDWAVFLLTAEFANGGIRISWCVVGESTRFSVI